MPPDSDDVTAGDTDSPEQPQFLPANISGHYLLTHSQQRSEEDDDDDDNYSHDDSYDPAQRSFTSSTPPSLVANASQPPLFSSDASHQLRNPLAHAAFQHNAPQLSPLPWLQQQQQQQQYFLEQHDTPVHLAQPPVQGSGENGLGGGEFDEPMPDIQRSPLLESSTPQPQEQRALGPEGFERQLLSHVTQDPDNLTGQLFTLQQRAALRSASTASTAGPRYHRSTQRGDHDSVYDPSRPPQQHNLPRNLSLSSLIQRRTRDALHEAQSRQDTESSLRPSGGNSGGSTQTIHTPNSLRRTTGFPHSSQRVRRAAEILSRQGLGANVRLRSSSSGSPTSTTGHNFARLGRQQANSQLSTQSTPDREALPDTSALDAMETTPDHGEYNGWAPGTTANEHASRPMLSTLRAMARGHQRARERELERREAEMNDSNASGATLNEAVVRDDGNVPTATVAAASSSSSSSPPGGATPSSMGRSVTMTSLERRYWQEQARQYESRAAAARAAQAERQERAETVRRAIRGDFRSSIVDINGNPISPSNPTPIDHGNGNINTPRTIMYNIPTPPHSQSPQLPFPPPSNEPSSSSTAASVSAQHQQQHSRPNGIAADIYDLHRELEEMHAHAETFSAMQRRELQARTRELQRAARRFTAQAAANGDAGFWTLHRARDSTMTRDELRRGLHDLHRDRVHASSGDGSNTTVPSSGSPSAAASEATRRWIEASIIYLHRLTGCDTEADKLRAAEMGGFVTIARERDGEMAFRMTCASDSGDVGAGEGVGTDFILDPKVIPRAPPTSWLMPGTVFSGSQHAVTVSALHPIPGNVWGAGTGAERTPSGAGGGASTTTPRGPSRIPTATASSNPASSTFRPSWIESVIQRDRHTGVSALANNSQGRSEAGTSTGGSTSRGDNSRPQPMITTAASGGAALRHDNEDTWPVKVTITSVDYERCTLTGTMEAMNVPNKPRADGGSNSSSNTTAASGRATSGGNNERPQQSTITTFLEGEIIDLNQHSLETKGFNADSVVDSTYWRRLEPFKSLRDGEIASKLVSVRWLREKIGREWVLMRWKEKCFVTPSEAGMGLTISGFYYISLNRQTGRIEGLYYDPLSSPYQHLCLSPERKHFSNYQFR